MPTPTGFTSLIAAHIQDASGNKLASGTLEVMPTDNKNAPITATSGGEGGAIMLSPAVFAITDGAIPEESYIADTTLTKPQNISYRFTVKNADGRIIYTVAGIQPSGPSFNFDTFTPNVAQQAIIQPGPPGPSGTLEIGEVTTLAAGADATVDNSGTSSAAVLNFGIPQGDKGDIGDVGPAGPPATFKGTYAAGTTYAVGDAVTYGNNAYVSLVASNTGNTPSSSPTQWGALVRGLTFRGAWAASTAYAVNDVLYYAGNLYNVVTAFTSGASFSATNLAVLMSLGPASAPASALGYTSINPANLASSSVLSAGVLVYGVASGVFGMDLGAGIGGPQFSLRSFAPNAAQFGFVQAFHIPAGVPTDQSSTSFPLVGSVLTAAALKLYPAYDGTNAKHQFNSDGSASHAGSLTVLSLTVSGTNALSLGGDLTAKIIRGGKASAAATMSDYCGVNTTGLNSGTSVGAALNAGIGVFQSGGRQAFGMDFGSGTAGYQTRLFAPDNGTITLAFYPQATPPTNQDGFTIVPVRAEPTIVKFFSLPSNATGSKATIDNAGNATFAGNVTISGTLTATVVPPAGVGFNISDAINPYDAVSLVQQRSRVMSRSDSPFSYLVPCSGMAYVAYGDSITAGNGLTSPSTNVYVARIAAALGATLTNRGIGGDECADTTLHAFNYENSSSTSNKFYTVQIGTNDANDKGVGAHEVDFNKFHQALLAWLGTRSENRVAGDSVSAANWSTDSTFAAISGKTSNTNGAVITYNLTTYGKPIYLWSLVKDGNGGTFTYSVDGGSPVTVSCAPNATISTPNGATQGVILTRIPVAAGAHAITITVTSATSASNVVTIVALGTPSPHTYYTSPTVAVGGVVPQANDVKRNIVAQYTMDVMDNVALLQGDGLDIRYVDNRLPLRDGDVSIYQTAPNLHPNDAGHGLFYVPYVRTLQQPPATSVSRDTPLSSAGKGTPGDSWAAPDGYLYAVVSSGDLRRTAISTW